VSGVSWLAWQALTVDEALTQCRRIKDETGAAAASSASLVAPIERRLRFLADLGLSGLRLSRTMNTLSHGQTQFVRLSAHLAGELSGVTTILDEPGQGLSREEKPKLKGIFERLVEQKNTVVIVEHDPDLIALCDHVIELGPGAGDLGGVVLYAGQRSGLAASAQSRIAPWLKDFSGLPASVLRGAPEARLRFPEIRVRDLIFDEVALPFARWTVLTGAMACGKSTFLSEVAAAQGRIVAAARATKGGFFPGGVKMLDELSFPRTPHSHVASLCGVWDALRRWYAQLPLARARGYDAARFSTTRAHDGRCLRCSGTGEVLVDTGGLSQLATTCPLCEGRRYTPQTLEITWRGYSIADVLSRTVKEAGQLFAHFPEIQARLTLLTEVGLDYLRLGQPSRSLSGGELQRLALARELLSTQPACFLLDEPLGGLHPDDVVHLVRLFHRLVDQGHTLITVDHTGWLVPCADLHLTLSRHGDRVSFS
jgi:excinuclease ABC subunit A